MRAGRARPGAEDRPAGLCLRLAVCRLALPAGTPVVLDDALVCFDDTRLRRALDALQFEAQTRQILLLTCQSREENILHP